MIKAVIDTNVFLSAIFWGGAPAEAVKRILSKQGVGITFPLKQAICFYITARNRLLAKIMQETITIPKEEYDSLKKKACFADDVLLQLESSLRDAEAGRVRFAGH